MHPWRIDCKQQGSIRTSLTVSVGLLQAKMLFSKARAAVALWSASFFQLTRHRVLSANSADTGCPNSATLKLAKTGEGTCKAPDKLLGTPVWNVLVYWGVWQWEREREGERTRRMFNRCLQSDVCQHMFAICIWNAVRLFSNHVQILHSCSQHERAVADDEDLVSCNVPRTSRHFLQRVCCSVL